MGFELPCHSRRFRPIPLPPIFAFAGQLNSRLDLLEQIIYASFVGYGQS